MSVTFPYPSPRGYTCAICGSWVGDGCTHFCPTSAVPPTPKVTVHPTPEERIAAALERIADQLEARREP